MARRGRLILIVDPDLDFVEGTRLLLDGERLLTARSLGEAKEIADGCPGGCGRARAVVRQRRRGARRRRPVGR